MPVKRRDRYTGMYVVPSAAPVNINRQHCFRRDCRRRYSADYDAFPGGRHVMGTEKTVSHSLSALPHDMSPEYASRSYVFLTRNLWPDFRDISAGMTVP